MIVQCTRCGLKWDDTDPDCEVCECLDLYGTRIAVVVLAADPPESDNP